MENLEDMLKIDKNLMPMKRGSCDHFLAKIKFSEPGAAELVSRLLVLVAGLFTFQVPDVSSDVNRRNMVWNQAEISSRKNSSNNALFMLLYILFHFCPSIFSLFLDYRCFLGFFDFLFLFF